MSKTKEIELILETIEQRDEIIEQQREIIAGLLNQTVEQENFINEFIKDGVT